MLHLPVDMRSPSRQASGLMQVARTLAVAQLDKYGREPAAIAKELRTSQRVQEIFQQRAAVPAGTTLDSGYAGNLVYSEISEDFGASMLNDYVVDSLKPHAIQAGINMSANVATQATIGSATAEAAPKPVRSGQWTLRTPEMYKATVILVASDELLRSAHADRLLAAEARSGAGVAGDSQALTVLKVGASVENATAGGAAALLANIGSAVENIPTTSQSVLLGYMSPTLTKRIATLPSASGDGSAAFPDFSATAGGVIAGVTFIPSDAAAVEYDITSGGDIVIVDATQVVLCDLGFTTRVSREAALQMDDAPTNPPVAATVLVSMFQMNMTAILVERVVGIAKMRATAAAVISGANYSAS